MMLSVMLILGEVGNVVGDGVGDVVGDVVGEPGKTTYYLENCEIEPKPYFHFK